MVHAADESKVVVQGLDGYIVAEKNGQLLVCSLKEEHLLFSRMGCYHGSKIIPSFFTIKEGSTSHLGLLPSGKKRKTALRCSEPRRYKVGGPSKVCARLCGLGPPGVGVSFLPRGVSSKLLLFPVRRICGFEVRRKNGSSN